MDMLTTLITGFLGGLAVGPFFWVVATLLFLYVATRNYRALRSELPPLLWPPGEVPLGQIDVDWFVSRSRTVLTNRRMLHWRVSWFLSRRRLTSIALQDVRSIVMHRHMNWALLLVAAYLVGTFNPLAFALLLIGLQARIYSIRANTPFSQMPLTRVVVATRLRTQLPEIIQFYRLTQSVWSQGIAQSGVQATNGQVPTVTIDAVPERETDFEWGRPLLILVIGVMVAASLQRALTPHVSFDDYVFAPLYLGLPVALACRSLRDGIWMAALGWVGLIAVKFPGGGLLGFLVADGGFPDWAQYGVALITLLGITLAAHGLRRLAGPVFAPFAILLWAPFVAHYIPGALEDLSLYSRIALAMAVSVLLMALIERMAPASPEPVVTVVHE